MDAKEMVEMCTDPKCDCKKCPWKDDEQSCYVVLEAIHRLRHPNWYSKIHANTEKPDEPTTVFVPRTEAEKTQEAINKAVESVVLYGNYDINGGQKAMIVSDTFKTHSMDVPSMACSNEIREQASELEAILLKLPNSRENSLARTKLEECVMWATKAIALHGVK